MRSVALLVIALCGIGCGGGKEAAKVPELPTVDTKALERLVSAVEASKSADGYGKAIELLREAVAADGRLWEAHYDLGVLLASRGELDEAETHLATAAGLAPNAEDVVVALAEARRRKRDAKGAVTALQPFVKSYPNALDARVALVGALRESGAIGEAIEQAREVLVRRSNDPNALAELALSHLERDEMDTAELLSAEALKSEEKTAVAERTAGLIALERGDDAVAFTHFAKASELDPADTTARLNVGTVLLRAGIGDTAQKEFEAVLKVAPDDQDAALGLAASLRAQGRRDKPELYQRAEGVLKDILQKSPKNLAATFNLAVLYGFFMERPKDAAPLFERFLERAPSTHPSRPTAEAWLKRGSSAAGAGAPAAPSGQ